MKPVEYSDFKKLDMRVGKVMHVERIKRTEKLYKIHVDIGEGNKRQIISSLVPYYSEQELIGKQIIILVNLKQTKFAGELSEGMLLCAETENGSECVLLTPQKEIKEGTSII